MRPYVNTNATGRPVPNFPEVSGLRSKFSTRETDSPNRVHYKQQDQSAQITAMATTLRSVVSTLNRLRIRGNGAGSSAAQNQFLGEYSGTTDTAGGYSLGNIVVVSTGDNQGTYTYVNTAPSSGAASPWTGGGYWVQYPGGLYSQWM